MKKSKPQPPVLPADDGVANVTHLDALDLTTPFTKISSDIAHWTERYAKALGRLLRAEAYRKRTQAELFLEIKKTQLEGGKYPSEEVAKAALQSNPRFIDAQEAEIDAEVARVRINGICEALRAKKDALVSLGADVRAERGGDPRIRDVEHTRARQTGQRPIGDND